MKIILDSNETKYLMDKGIIINSLVEYDDDEVFEILDKIRDVEIFYAQDSDISAQADELANIYGNIADKIQDMLPE